MLRPHAKFSSYKILNTLKIIGKEGRKIGRPRKPLEMQKGNLTIETKIQKETEENMITIGRQHLARSPTWLIDTVAKKEFKRIVKEFDSVGVIGNLDLNNIAGYCNAYAFYLRATEELKDQSLTIIKKLPNGSSNIAENPLIKIQKIYAEEMRKFASLCGLTIDSRLKIATVKVSEQDQGIQEEFGEI